MANDGKVYLGDGIYAEVEYGDAVITTSDGVSETNPIVFGRVELCNLMTWAEAVGLIISTRKER